MNLEKILEASHIGQPNIRVIAAWLDSGLANMGWYDDADEQLAYILENDTQEYAWQVVDEVNMCIDFISQNLNQKLEKMSDAEAEELIGIPRPR